MRRFVFIFLILVFCIIYYYATSNDPHSVAVKSAKATKEMFNKVTNSQIFMSPQNVAQQSASTDMSQNQTSQVAIDLGQLNLVELRRWISAEANSMNSTLNKTAEIELQLKAQVRTLRSDQIIELQKLAVSAGEPINDRILSAYMLIERSAEEQSGALAEVAKAELPDLGPILAHSEAELRRGQELAIRYMAVDALAEKAITDANARNELRLLSLEAKSAEVRQYAARKLKDLK